MDGDALMAMKPIRLLAPMGYGFKKSLGFKWEWKVSWEYNGLGEWEYFEEKFENRAGARYFKYHQLYVDKAQMGGHRPIPHTCFRNVKLHRRLVQTNWEEYNDSFTWNAGCGKR